ncbi:MULTISPECIES: C40 family peptidase [unclassified Arthrobacter]|uniref:C40 family peptidase n=1 Tax=unclassified Arthrobacter TaxID=235627 RepID=UPI001CFFDE39|nr:MULTISPECIES: C40 family peptidase [unclassified Arthrobacter]MCB5283778.1 Murein DD-endopeptidase MepH [Arthrobacter sp. ES1]WGZ79946.1 NlpC/P60 family protein [Arthrobacter sp. EM1]
MSMTEAIGRMQSIQSMISELTTRPVDSAKSTAISAAATGSPVNGGGDGSFTQALASALGTSGTGTASLQESLNSLTGISGTTLKGVSAPVATGGAATGNDVVAAAKKYIGVPYVWGGTNPATGMDCSGFTQRVFKDLGVEIPRVVSDQMRQGTPVASLAEAKPGDLLVSFGGNHISIYLGNGKAIDAPVPGQTIQIRDAWEQQSNLTSIRRIVPAGGTS